MKSNDNPLSGFVKEHRKKLKLTQLDLAEKSGVGLRFVRELEQGKKTLRLDKVNAVLALFGYENGPVRVDDNRQQEEEDSPRPNIKTMHPIAKTKLSLNIRTQKSLNTDIFMKKEGENINLRILTWNLGFGSGKKDLMENDTLRFQKVIDVVKNIDPDVVTFQEIVNRDYSDKTPPFRFEEAWSKRDNHFSEGHFQAALSLNDTHTFPFGKSEDLKKEKNVILQTSGLGIFLREKNRWQLANLYSNEPGALPRIEVQRPMPHPLYMGSSSQVRAGRDEEDRPCLWARISSKQLPDNLIIYFVALHLPTLAGEEQNRVRGDLNASQINILENVLGFPASGRADFSVEELGSSLRLYMLRQLVFQARRMENFWLEENPENKCVFIFGGDFNFLQTNEVFRQKKPEQYFLENQGFEAIKKTGFTRIEQQRLHDNIWVKIPATSGNSKLIVQFSEYQLFDGNGAKPDLNNISDHFPVVGDINLRLLQPATSHQKENFVYD